MEVSESDYYERLRQFCQESNPPAPAPVSASPPASPHIAQRENTQRHNQRNNMRPATETQGRQQRRRLESPAAEMDGGFITNEELGEEEAPRPGRAPTDTAPYDTDDDEEEHQCVFCVYGPDMKAAGQIDAHSEIVVLIKKHHANSISSRELVALVSEAYEKKIRLYRDYGPWSKRSIWNHIMHHMADADIQTNENASNILAQIEALRQVAWTKLPQADGRVSYTPALGNLKLMVELIKTHNTMLGDSRKRAQR